ncbi:tyrosine-type recombinase/integrase [Micromonospora echinaurantiaca]|uniref:tyrosine-type recombinase/integrase n=1 Tax=Micromonospora echinaurantiaca TaxID=47857 RepID=UPI0037913C62
MWCGHPNSSLGDQCRLSSGVRETGGSSHQHSHMLRHTFVTTMLDAGASLRDVQNAARHADP